MLEKYCDWDMRAAVLEADEVCGEEADRPVAGSTPPFRRSSSVLAELAVSAKSS